LGSIIDGTLAARDLLSLVTHPQKEPSYVPCETRTGNEIPHPALPRTPFGPPQTDLGTAIKASSFCTAVWYNGGMNLFPAGSSLIDIISRAKAAQGKKMAIPTPAKTSEQKLGDQVTLSAAAQERLDKAKKVNGYLQVFSAALKLINTGKTLPDMSSFLNKLDGTASKTNKINTRV